MDRLSYNTVIDEKAKDVSEEFDVIDKKVNRFRSTNRLIYISARKITDSMNKLAIIADHLYRFTALVKSQCEIKVDHESAIHALQSGCPGLILMYFRELSLYGIFTAEQYTKFTSIVHKEQGSAEDIAELWAKDNFPQNEESTSDYFKRYRSASSRHILTADKFNTAIFDMLKDVGFAVIQRIIDGFEQEVWECQNSSPEKWSPINILHFLCHERDKKAPTEQPQRNYTSDVIAKMWVQNNHPHAKESAFNYHRRYNLANPSYNLSDSKFGLVAEKLLFDLGYTTTQCRLDGGRTRIWVKIDEDKDVTDQAPQSQIAQTHKELSINPALSAHEGATRQPQQRPQHPADDIGRPKYIYFMAEPANMTDPNFENTPREVKIGKSINPHARLKQLRTAKPRLELITTIACDADRVERDLHRIHRARCTGGEWFHFTRSELADAVDAAWILVAGEDELS